MAEYFPAAQSEQTDEPGSAAKRPGVHSWHTAADTDPTLELAEPAQTQRNETHIKIVSRHEIELSRKAESGLDWPCTVDSPVLQS